MSNTTLTFAKNVTVVPGPFPVLLTVYYIEPSVSPANVVSPTTIDTHVGPKCSSGVIQTKDICCV